MFSETELSILKNFGNFNPTQTIYPDGFRVKKHTNAVIGFYKFEKPYDFEPFGIYNINEFLSVVNGFKAPEMVMQSNCVVIEEGSNRAKYFTSPLAVMPKIPNIHKKFESVECELKFDFPGDKFETVKKMASILKTKFIYFESDGDKVRIVAANELESSNNMFEIIVNTGISENSLTTPVKINIEELSLFDGDYSVNISSRGISSWSNLNGIEYFIGCSV